MSVILRRNNKILLYCKGADNVVYDRLGPNQHELRVKTQEHLNVSCCMRNISLLLILLLLLNEVLACVCSIY